MYLPSESYMADSKNVFALCFPFVFILETKMETPKPVVCFKFEVEKVVGVSSDGRYKVQWAPSWVSKFHLIDCDHLIQEFLREEESVNRMPDDSLDPSQSHKLPNETPEVESHVLEPSPFSIR